jgi:glucose-6-phosphate isomerase
MLQKNNTPDIQTLIESEPGRSESMVRETPRWRFDASRTPIPASAWRKIVASEAISTAQRAMDALFAGAIVNSSEAQPALHMALRAAEPSEIAPADDAATIERSLRQLLDCARRLHDGSAGVRTLVHVGIGGSDLGPRLVADALDAGNSAVDIEWLTTLDARRVERLQRRLDPSTTGIVVASKSFSTVETLFQAAHWRDWLNGRPDRIWAATARPEKAVEFGVPVENVLAFPAWTGGRFSLWSSVGLSAAACIGPERWQQLLNGAARVDERVRNAVGDSAAFALAGCIDSLVRRFGFGTLGVVSYEPALRMLAEYLQQLVMESLGKSTSLSGAPVLGPTSPLVFGGAGTDLQHSLFQALHQGTTRHPMLLLGTASTESEMPSWQREQMAHLLGQASALVNGREDERPERSLPGNNPVLLMLAPALDAETLGELLATLEHAVYLLGVAWDINPFDQWGVEEGKRLAVGFRQALERGSRSPDPALDRLVDWVRSQGNGETGL